MNDLKKAFEQLEELYKRSNAEVPVLLKFSLGRKWAMAEDKEHISLALRIGKELPEEEYQKALAPYYGKPADRAIQALLNDGNEAYREPVTALLNLMSKPLNTKEFLSKQGITCVEGMAYPYGNAGKKTGLVGFGGFAKLLLPKSEEFHVYDLRPAEKIQKSPQAALYEKLKDKAVWHLGENAAEEKESLAGLDIVIISGSSIVNNTYMDILSACTHASVAGLYGPSNELCPEYLFAQGFNYIFSTNVKDKEIYKSVTASGKPYVEFDYMDLYTLAK